MNGAGGLDVKITQPSAAEPTSKLSNENLPAAHYKRFFF